jgi:hypothetical protein
LTFLRRTDIEGYDHDLVLIGGESDLGTYNDIWIFSISQAMWMIPDILGEIPKLKVKIFFIQNFYIRLT